MADLILRGPPSKGPEINKSIGEYFFEQANKYGDKVFQIDARSGKKETFSDVKRRSVRVALYLQKIGVKPEDKVLLCCLNNLDNIVPVLAALYLGACVSSIDSKQGVVEVNNALALLEPSVIVAEKGALDLIEESLKQVNQKPHIISIGSTSSGKYKDMWEIERDGEGESDFRPAKLKASAIALIMFSSGTSSLPKGICLTHWSVLNGINSMTNFSSQYSGISIHFVSLIWSSSWIVTISCIINGGAKLISPNIRNEELFQIIEKYKATSVFFPTSYTYELTKLDESIARKYDTSSLVVASIGGAILDSAQVVKIRRYLPHSRVNLAYGATEVGGLAVHSSTNAKAAKEKVASSGLLVADLQMKFIDLETGKLLGPNQKGEMRVKSPYIMAGYYKLPKPDVFDEDGFYKLEDLGYYDDEGYIYVTDRISERFRYRGFFISPGLLEAALLEHPAVAEAVVFGIPHSEDTNHSAACVVLKPGATIADGELEEFVKPKMPDNYQLRGGAIIVESIPKNTSGKYQRRKAREYFMELKGL